MKFIIGSILFLLFTFKTFSRFQITRSKLVCSKRDIIQEQKFSVFSPRPIVPLCSQEVKWPIWEETRDCHAIFQQLSLSPCLQSRLTHPIPHHEHHHHHHVDPQVCCEVQRAADPHPGGGRVLLQAATCLQAGTSPQHYAGWCSIGNFTSLIMWNICLF